MSSPIISLHSSHFIFMMSEMRKVTYVYEAERCRHCLRKSLQWAVGEVDSSCCGVREMPMPIPSGGRKNGTVSKMRKDEKQWHEQLLLDLVLGLAVSLVSE